MELFWFLLWGAETCYLKHIMHTGIYSTHILILFFEKYYDAQSDRYMNEGCTSGWLALLGRRLGRRNEEWLLPCSSLMAAGGTLLEVAQPGGKWVCDVAVSPRCSSWVESMKAVLPASGFAQSWFKPSRLIELSVGDFSQLQSSFKSYYTKSKLWISAKDALK